MSKAKKQILYEEEPESDSEMELEQVGSIF